MAGYKAGKAQRSTPDRSGRLPVAKGDAEGFRQHAKGTNRRRKTTVSRVITGSSLTVAQAQRLETALEPVAFSASCLPRTIALAQRFQGSLMGRLPPLNALMPFEDRVLLWLAPNWAEDVVAFHAAARRRSGLIDRFTPNQVEHFDEVYERELRSRLDAL